MKNSFFCISILFIYLACTQPDEVKDPPPQKVDIVLKTVYSDTLANEQGIDAEPNPSGGGNMIQIMWKYHPQTSKLSHFNIYRSVFTLTSKVFELVGVKYIDGLSLSDTMYNDTKDLVKDTRYSYVVTAVDKNDLESSHSDTVSYMLTEKAVELSLNNSSPSDITSTDLWFKWAVESGETPERYYLRIERIISQTFHPLVYVEEIKSTYQTPQSYNLTGNWLKQTLENGQYRWRIDCVGNEDYARELYSGAESDWAFFSVNWGSK